jgi:hypothetical protein
MIRVRAIVASGLTLALLSAGSAVGSARDVDLGRGSATFIVGASRVAAAGDVNGDGIPDLLVSRGSLGSSEERGRSWVIFGSRPMPKRIDLDDLGDRGFLIKGAEDGDLAYEISSAGDVNGDGLDDVIVGASASYRAAPQGLGRAYVIFGKTTSEPVDLAHFDLGIQGLQGFRIDGPGRASLAGRSVTGLGDLNGDGLDDVAIAAPFGGTVYVVFGKPDPLPVDLELFHRDLQGVHGYRIEMRPVTVGSLMTVAAAGDVNGDGIPDLVIGALRNYGSRGMAHVVFGKSDAAPQDVRERGDWGFLIQGPKGGSMFGEAVAGAGDVNGDGLADVIIGSPSLCCSWRSAYVVFGKKGSATVTIKRKLKGPRRVGRFGFEIRGAQYEDDAGARVAGAGDVDGDGLDDLLVGAPMVSVGARTRTGAAYVIRGQRGSRVIDLATSSRAYRMHGVDPYDFVGNYVAGVGDVNGDGVPDVLLGAPGQEKHRVFLVYGRR